MVGLKLSTLKSQERIDVDQQLDIYYVTVCIIICESSGFKPCKYNL
jgi:hypothetical protein